MALGRFAARQPDRRKAGRFSHDPATTGSSRAIPSSSSVYPSGSCDTRWVCCAPANGPLRDSSEMVCHHSFVDAQRVGYFGAGECPSG